MVRKHFLLPADMLVYHLKSIYALIEVYSNFLGAKSHKSNQKVSTHLTGSMSAWDFKFLALYVSVKSQTMFLFSEDVILETVFFFRSAEIISKFSNFNIAEVYDYLTIVR